MRFLALDVGNTRLKWALYEQPHPHAGVIAQGVEFLEQIERLAEGPWSTLPAPGAMLGCIVAADSIRLRVQEQLELWDLGCNWVVASAAEAGVTNGYDHPARLGAVVLDIRLVEHALRRQDGADYKYQYHGQLCLA